MKTKFYWLALLASAALAIPAQAGGRGGGGGGHSGFAGGGGGHFSSGAHTSGGSYHSMSHANFGGGRFGPSGQRFSSIGARPFRQPQMINSSAAGHRFDGPRTVNHRENGLARGANNHRFENRGANSAHVFARRTAGWHRDWNRSRDHWWHGHRCHFVNDSWFIYDLGFYDYGYPYDYYSDDSSYSSDEYTDSSVAAVQAQLSRQGYYQGSIDGIYGAGTRRAVLRYQSNHGLRTNGNLDADTLNALGLPQVANR